jgi:hypothetical protein
MLHLSPHLVEKFETIATTEKNAKARLHLTSIAAFPLKKIKPAEIFYTN